MLGGLISESETDDTTRLPFFGDLPVAGWAFKHNQRLLTKENLMIFLTVLIDRGPEDAYDIYKANQIHERGKPSPIERLFPADPALRPEGWKRTESGAYRFGG